MTTTTYYGLNIVEGADIVNPLIVDNPNYEKIDNAMHENAVSGVTLATEIENATVHAITRENSECSVIRFISTSRWKAGDTATVDGVPVTALLPSGETLPDGAYVINANVLCILTGTNLTVYVEGKKTQNANDIKYNDTTVGAELVRLDGEVDNLNSNLTNLLKVVPITQSLSIAANVENGGNYNHTSIPNGYTCIGCVGVELSNTNCSLIRFGANSAVYYFTVRNMSAQNITLDVTLRLLCFKNI